MFRKPKRKVNQETLRSRKTDDDEQDNDDEHNKKALASAERKHDDDDDNNDDDYNEESTTDLIREAQKRAKKATTSAATATATTTNNDGGGKAAKQIMHSFATSKTPGGMSHAERATSTAQHLPEKLLRGGGGGGGSDSGVAAVAAAAAGGGGGGPKDDDDDDKEPQAAASSRGGDDGIFRGHQARNKFWAGPIRAAANVRVTARFDYQPDICKDYKDTGFCGFGDTCIYLHDRGDTLAGWQIDQQWETAQKAKKEAQELQMQNFLDQNSASSGGKSNSGGDGGSIESADDGLPFACFLCREYFKEPFVTTCQHYFCQDCIMDHIRNNHGGSSADAATFCPICKKDTHGVFHQPTKLLAKKRKALGTAAAAKAENSWEEFYRLYSTTAR
jgi:RING finger protein 113A